MRKLMVLALAAMLAGFMIPAVCGAQVNLIADGRDAPDVVGTVTPSVVGDDLSVTYAMDSPWCLKDAHVDVQMDDANFPVNNGGNVKMRDFGSKAEFPFECDNGSAPCTGGWTAVFSLTAIGANPGDTVYIAAHAGIVDNSLGCEDDNEDLWVHESAWADGTAFHQDGKKNWAMYFEYVIPGP
jgi:hypothetical protein